MVITLLSVRWLSLKNAVLRGAARDRRKTVMSLIWSPAIIVIIGAMSYQFFDPFVALGQRDPSMATVLERMPAFAFFSAFWMLLLSAVTVAIQTFYLSQELPLLLAAPISPRAIFMAKFVEATAANAALFLTIGAPVLLAYAFARGYITPPFLVHLLVVLVAFAALPTGIGVLATFVLMRILPANRTRDMLAAMGIAAFALVYVLLSISVPRLSDASTMQRGAEQLARVLSAPLFDQGPWAWAGRVVNGSLTGAAAWSTIGLLVFVAALGVATTALVGHWIHQRGWAAAQEAPNTGRTPASVGVGWERRMRFIPGPMRAVVLKDLRSLGRDMRQLSLFFIPIAVIAVFLVNIQLTPRMQVIPPGLLSLALYPVLAMISLRLAMSGFVTENRALWLMLAAPNDPATVLAGKFLYSYCLSIPLAAITTLIYGFIMGAAGSQWLSIFGLMFCAVGGFCGIGVGASVVFSDFKADVAGITMSAGARTITFVIQMGYLLMLVALTATAWYLTDNIQLSPVLVWSAAAVLVFTVSLSFVLAPLAIGSRRLRSLEW